MKDLARAQQIFSSLAEKEFHELFKGVQLPWYLTKKDPVRAKELFQRAVDANDPRGMFIMAGMLQDEGSVEKSLHLRVKAWEEHNFVDSLVMLGVFYMRGIAVLHLHSFRKQLSLAT